MHDDFVPLAVFLRPREEPPAGEPAASLEPALPPERPVAAEPTQVDEALSEARRFRAALADAFDVALQTLLREIACDVLARELRIEPVDLAALVVKTRERYAGEEVLAVRAHRDELDALGALGLPVLADARLRRGDVALELHSGTIDASLGVRLEAVLARCAM